MYFRLNDNPSELMEKIKSDSFINWWTKTESLMEEFSLDKEELFRVKNKKKIIKDKVMHAFRLKLLHEYGIKSKVTYLVSNTTSSIDKMNLYLKKCTRVEASCIFKARSRMLDFKANFKGKYTDQSCRLCKNTVESHDHILFECPSNNFSIKKEDLFDDRNLHKIKKVAWEIKKLVNKLDDAQTTLDSGSGLAN